METCECNMLVGVIAEEVPRLLVSVSVPTYAWSLDFSE